MWKVLVVAACLALAACGERAASPFTAIDISGARYGSSLGELRDHHGRPVAMADYRGKLVVVFFGYTACPDVCPTALARFADVLKQLGDDAARVQVLFISVDPERDTPERLAVYVPWFEPSFIGLVGDAAATRAVADEFHVYFARSAGSAGMAYAVDHSADSYVFDAGGKIRLLIRPATPVPAITDDLRRLLAEKAA